MSGTRQATGSATPVSPAASALQENKLPPLRFSRRMPAAGSEPEESRRSTSGTPAESFLDEQTEITAIFKRMLSGSHGLGRDERAAAVKAARDWLWQALKALQEKRAAAAGLRKALRQLQGLKPS